MPRERANGDEFVNTLEHASCRAHVVASAFDGLNHQVEWVRALVVVLAGRGVISDLTHANDDGRARRNVHPRSITS
jgi:hypothetical protein